MTKLQRLRRDIWRSAQAKLRPLGAWVMRHKAWSAAFGVVVTVLVVGQLFASCGNERAIKERIARLAKERYGLVVEIQRVSVRLGGVRLRDVVVHNGAAGGLRVQSDQVWVRANPMALAVGGTGAIWGVQADGVRMVIDLSRSGFKPWLQRMARQASSGSSGRGTSRELTMQDLTLTVRDGQGDLLQAREGEFRRDAQGMRLELGQCDIGSLPAEVAQLRQLHVYTTRHDGRRVLKEAHVRSAALSWAPGQLQTRTRIERVRALLRQVQAQQDKARPAQEYPLSWLAKDARLGVDNLSVQLRGTTGESRLLKQLHGELKGDGSGLFKAVGKGRVHGGGGLDWNLRLWPEQVRADGTVTLRQVPLALLLPLLPELPWYEPDQAMVNAKLALRTDNVVNVAVSGELAVAGIALYSPRISELPVSSGRVALKGQGLWRTAGRRLELKQASVMLDRLGASVTGALEHAKDHFVVDLNLTVPMTSCNVVMGAIPRQLLDDIVNFSWHGNWGADIRLKIDSRAYDATEFILRARNQCRFVEVPRMADLRTFQGPFLHRVYEPDGTMFEMHTGPGTPNWVPIAQISPFMIHAVLAQEDAGFFKHRGFATAEIAKALAKNLKAGRYVQGASTITMQLVKNLLLHREKTLARKVQEVILTWWIEQALDKKEILELYLNVIEFGPNVYGIRQASLYYFGRTAADLSPAESVFLSVILPNPKAYAGQVEQHGLSEGWRKRIQKRLEHLYKRGRIDQLALQYGVSELAQFGFHRGGIAPPPRVISGQASPLPFDQNASPLHNPADEPATEAMP
jgi:hypothetical protein